MEKIFIFLMAAAVMFSACEADAGDKFLDDLISGRHAQRVNANSRRSFEYSKMASRAWEQGDCVSAVKYRIASEKLNDTEVSVNTASFYVELAILAWNIREYNDALKCMATAIRIMQTDRHLGSGCEQRAVVFFRKMQQGQLPRYFNYTTGQKVLLFIMDIPYALYGKKMDALKRRYAAMGAYFDSMTKSYQLQGESQARTARLQARQEYQQRTGSTFSPNHPPAYGTPARAEWDACKAIYDIFGN